MRLKRLFWQIFPPLLLVAGVSVAAASWYAAEYMRRYAIGEKAVDLEAAARLAIFRLGDSAEGDPAAFEASCQEMGRESRLRITVVHPSGRVLCDSAENPAGMENHADRPEVREALAGKSGRAVRYSFTLRQPFLYVAVPLRRQGGVAAAVRLSVPLQSVEDALGAIRRHLLGAAFVITLLGAAASYLISRRIVGPIEELTEGADRFARGDLRARLPVPPVLEIAALATAMNDMAEQLAGRIATIQEQGNTMGAILEGMAEGVLAIDAAKRLLLLNHAAAKMLGMEPGAAAGRTILDLPRNLPLQAFIARALGTTEPAAEEIAAGEDGALVIRARGAPLRDAAGAQIGALIVLNDITRLHRLEQVRRDFVANVSHELKTPITSIAGFVETLLDGALDDRATAEHFLEIMRRQADRLNAIVTDLLSLARLEQQAEDGGVPLEEANLRDILAEAVEAARDRAEKKDISLELESPAHLPLRANALHLSQAVINLIDNAVAASLPGQRVLVRGIADAAGVRIEVVDCGVGIAREHLPRLFERFYRVDKSRSRGLGGTGLGLAIVKHVAQTHGGSVTVASEPGKGSTFTIRLPGAPAR
jgi:two-component system phosphate regulon sensor histidine kinase PhoR